MRKRNAPTGEMIEVCWSFLRNLWCLGPAPFGRRALVYRPKADGHRSGARQIQAEHNEQPRYGLSDSKAVR